MSCIGWYILAIVAFPTILMLVDAYIGYKRGGSELRGISGFRRAIIALTVILILGIAVFHLLANNTDTNSRAVVNNILSMLAGLVAAIAGFYFGGRFTEKRAEEAERRVREVEERERARGAVEDSSKTKRGDEE
ncbi:hypothetical protein CW713_08460 [Methanophagales archaeon]|nr:MAG: hypothetical protein CW713_08460 [Methanophagales archaeon]